MFGTTLNPSQADAHICACAGYAVLAVLEGCVHSQLCGSAPTAYAQECVCGCVCVRACVRTRMVIERGV